MKRRFTNLAVYSLYLAIALFLAAFYFYQFMAAVQSVWVITIDTRTLADVFNAYTIIGIVIIELIFSAVYWKLIPRLNKIQIEMAEALVKEPLSRAVLWKAIGGRKTTDQGTCYREIKKMVDRKLFIAEKGKIRLNEENLKLHQIKD